MRLTDLKQAYEAGALTKAEYIDAMHQAHQCLFEYADFIRHTDVARIEILDGQVVMTTRETGIRLLCGADKRIAPIEILNFGAYETTDAAMMRALIDEGDTVLDIGANVGFYTISLAKRFPSATVFAFEPIPATFAYLRRNIELNDVTNAQVRNFGLSDREAELTFYLPPANSVNASAADLVRDNESVPIICAVKRLDDFARTNQLTVDFLKCDVEGGEYLVFRGGEETLRRDRPIIMTEMLRKWSAQFHYHPNDIIRFLGAIGYRCFTVESGRLAPFGVMDDTTTATNFFFFHATKHWEKIARLERARCA